MSDAPRTLPSLYDLPISELPVPAGGTADFRRDQLAAWLYGRGAQSFEVMTNLPKAWREELADRYRIEPFDAVTRFPSRDGSVRYLFTLPDGLQTEAVYMPYANRRTVCVSSMVGCPAGCAFCATGALGFGRNLSRAEILAQVVCIAAYEKIAPTDIRNVVLMGMGEALLNYANAMGAVRTLVDPGALGMSPRRITLSTVGLPKHIRRLAGEGLSLVLALSLHAPDDETRKRIIPTAHAHPLAEIVDALRVWQEATGRRVTIEYTMLAGINDSAAHANGVVKVLADVRAHVNLIPFNPWPASGFKSSSREVIEAFRSRLERAGMPVSVRFSRSKDTGGACGQLALRGARPGPDVREARAGSAG